MPPTARPPAQDHDQMVTAEKSMFGTRLPRPTGVGRHLIVVVVVFGLALGIAIYFAERQPTAPAPEAPAQ
jgi:hypothetical protein